MFVNSLLIKRPTQSFLSRMCRPAALRTFGILGDPIEPRSIRDLEAIGLKNLAQTKAWGLDYESIINPEQHGLLDQPETYKSFEDEINKSFELKQSEAVGRHTKRCGLLGYKVGMTHFWDKWGVLVPCTVV